MNDATTAEARLRAYGRIAATPLRRAAWARVGAIGCTVAALGAAAGAATGTQPLWCGVAVAVILSARVAINAVAQRYSFEAGQAVAHSLSLAGLRRTHPPGGAAGSLSGGTAAQQTIELPYRIGDYHAQASPAGMSCAPATVLVLSVVAWAHWPAALLLAAATTIIPINMRVVGFATEDAAARQLDEVRALTARLHDRFRGLPTLTTLGAADRESAVVRRAGEGLARTSMVVLRRALIAGAVLDAVVTIAIALLATYCGLTLLGYLRLDFVPPLTLERALLVLMLAPVYFTPMRDLAAGYHLRDQALAAVAGLGNDPACEAGDDESSTRCGRPAAARHIAPVRIQARALTVRYSESAAPVLNSIDFDAAPGSVCILTGPSGAGKSTLLALIAGVRAPTAGSILVDDAAPVPTGCVWLGQHPVILEGSLADNIRLSNPTATRQMVLDAALSAGLAALLQRLPRSIDTPVGDNGFGLSAGEAQRVALARALLRDAPLWLLDEPTAHLDRATEAELLPVLAQAFMGRTVVVATHSGAVATLGDIRWQLCDGALTTESVGAL